MDWISNLSIHFILTYAQINIDFANQWNCFIHANQLS